MSERLPEPQRKGKKILIEEVEEDLCSGKEEQEEQRGENETSYKTVFLIYRFPNTYRDDEEETDLGL